MSKISLKHSGGNVVSLNSPTNAPGSPDVAFRLPNQDGSANEVLKTVLNLKSDLNTNMLIFNSLKMNMRTIKITINKNCINKCKK